MNPFQLTGKHILVTGASSGIGREIAISCSRMGARMTLTGRDSGRLGETLAALSGTGHKFFIADLTSEDSLSGLADSLDPVDGIVHSAGITTHMPTRFIRKRDIDQIFQLNFQSPVLLTSRLLKQKKVSSPGSIVFMSSIASRYHYFGGALYSSSKAALESYAHTLALELAPKKIRSNCLLPTFVRTPMIEEAGKTVSTESIENFEKLSPLGFGEPVDVARAAIFLLSDASSWITGAVIPMGGF